MMDHRAEIETLRARRAVLQADLDRTQARVTVEDPAACRLGPAGHRQRQRGYDRALERTAKIAAELRRVDTRLRALGGPL